MKSEEFRISISQKAQIFFLFRFYSIKPQNPNTKNIIC